MQTGPTGLHCTDVSSGRDLRRMAHDLDFRRGFIQTHIMQQVIQRNEFLRWLGPQIGLGADGVDPVHQVTVEGRVVTHRRIHPVTAFNQARQDVVNVSDGERIICAEVTNSTFLPGAQAVPQLSLGVALATKQHVLPMGTTGDQNDHGLRLGKTAQVLEIAVLTVKVFDITIANSHWRSRQYRDAVRPHLLHQRLAATCVFRFRDMDHGQTGSLLAINQCSEGLAAGASDFVVSVNSNSGATRRYSITCM